MRFISPLDSAVPVDLETPRLLLRQFRAADLDTYAAMSADTEGNDRSVKVAEKLGEHLAGETELLGSTALVYEALRRP